MASRGSVDRVPHHSERVTALDSRRVAVLGLGVMGGSLARALSALDPRPVVVGWDPDASATRAAREAGAIDEAAASLGDAVGSADLVVLAGPLSGALDDLPAVARAAPPDATVTDVASLKAPVARAAETAGLAERWVGSHPMCGSEERGFAAGRADLYRDARVWVVPAESGEGRRHLARVLALWTAVGARPEIGDADAHDRLMARVSHLPQLAANAVAAVLADAGVAPDLLGPGGRDVTRLAGSNPDMWADLVAHAPAGTVDALRALSARAGELGDAVARGDVEAVRALMERTQAWRSGT